jgi:hypothetical protein
MLALIVKQKIAIELRMMVVSLVTGITLRAQSKSASLVSGTLSQPCTGDLCGVRSLFQCLPLPQ